MPIPVPDQNAALNARPLVGDEIEDTRDAAAKYADWTKSVKAALGVEDLRADIADDNAALTAALAKIAAAGAPAPVRVKNTVAYPFDPSKSFENETLVFTHFQNPRLQYSAGEAWLALHPEIAIEDLRVAGIRAS